MLRILLDENMPRKFIALFNEKGIKAKTVDQCGWKGKENGNLLRLAQDKFDVFITTDQGIPHQQNLSTFKIGIVLIEAQSNRFADIAPLIDKVIEKANHAQQGTVVTVVHA